jgi:hypothetical protein
MKVVHIRSSLTRNGFVTYVNHRKIQTTYPTLFWNAFPKVLRKQFAQTASYYFSQHLLFSNSIRLECEFPPPMFTSLHFHGLAFALPATVSEIPNAKFSIAGLLQKLSNSEHRTVFKGIPNDVVSVRPVSVKKHTLLLPMSFGKDSLLTYAVAKEIGLTVTPVFMNEPTCVVQNSIKQSIARNFAKSERITFHTFTNTLGALRDRAGLMWGWDMLITQYTLMYLPYLYAYRSKYLFWSNEQSTNEISHDTNGYIFSPTYEQSVAWTLQLNNLLRGFSCNTKISSIIEPLHELPIMYILHRRYPDIGKYQLSCDSEQKRTHRWCEHCFECARIYIFLRAAGVDPKTVGFTGDMLHRSKAEYFFIFPKHTDKKSLAEVQRMYSERLLAFYIAYKRGVKGYLMNIFVKHHLGYVELHKDIFVEQYLSLHSMDTIPENLKTLLRPIYTEELKKFKKEIK